jgi:pSer/pThr/pTyr-binding forkhead associated (FHA) protein
LAKLTITSGPDSGKEFPLGDSQIIGRLKRCSIPIDDTRASREHARVYRSRDQFFVTDLNSKNGVVVNGETVLKAELNPGDSLRVGETLFRIDYEPSAFAAPSPGSGRQPPRPSPSEPLGSDVRVRATGTGISAEPIRTTAHRMTGGGDHLTRTSLAWLRTDLSQVSSLYRIMLYLGFVLVAVGLGYLAYMLAS